MVKVKKRRPGRPPRPNRRKELLWSKFPLLWLYRIGDPTCQVAALILEQHWLREIGCARAVEDGEIRRDKSGAAEREDLITVSDAAAAELGISPWAKRKCLRKLADLGLIVLKKRRGKDSTIDAIFAGT